MGPIGHIDLTEAEFRLCGALSEVLILPVSRAMAITMAELLAEVIALVEEADFHRPAHRAIWRAVLRLADRGLPTDPVTVLGELDDRRELANAGDYARLVADSARRRRVIDLGIQLAHSDAHRRGRRTLTHQFRRRSTVVP